MNVKLFPLDLLQPFPLGIHRVGKWTPALNGRSFQEWRHPYGGIIVRKASRRCGTSAEVAHSLILPILPRDDQTMTFSYGRALCARGRTSAACTSVVTRHVPLHIELEFHFRFVRRCLAFYQNGRALVSCIAVAMQLSTRFNASRRLSPSARSGASLAGNVSRGRVHCRFRQAPFGRFCRTLTGFSWRPVS